MDKQTVLNPYTGILLSHEKYKLLIHMTVCMNLNSIMPSERSQSQEFTYSDFIYNILDQTKL